MCYINFKTCITYFSPSNYLMNETRQAMDYKHKIEELSCNSFCLAKHIMRFCLCSLSYPE